MPVCVCVLVEGGIQFSAPYQQCQRTQLESEKGKRSLGLIFYWSIHMYTTALWWITAIMSRSPNLKMKQVTTVMVARGRITVAHLRTRLWISTAGNVKSVHASESALRPWQVLGSLQWVSCRKGARRSREFRRLMSGVLGEGQLPSPH